MCARMYVFIKTLIHGQAVTRDQFEAGLNLEFSILGLALPRLENPVGPIFAHSRLIVLFYVYQSSWII